MTIMQTRNNRRLGITLIEFMLVIAIVAILAAILTPSFLKAHSQAQLTACKSNVRNLGVACEMFAIDRKGRYPEQIAFLTLGAHGGYLKMIPTCPAAGYDTYTASYTFAKDPDCFTVRCGGANHIALNIPEGYPLYDSVVGLACTGEPGGSVASAGGSEASAAQQKAAEEAAAQKAAEEAAQKAAAELAAQKAAEEAAQKAAEEAAQKAAEEAAQKAAAELAAQKAAEEAAAQRAAAISVGTEFLTKLHDDLEGCGRKICKYKYKNGRYVNGKKITAEEDYVVAAWRIDENENGRMLDSVRAELAPYGLAGTIVQIGVLETKFPVHPYEYNPIVMSNYTEDQLYELGVSITLKNANANAPG